MSALDTRDELVPLHTDFDLVWRGCDRAQVQQYVQRVETELRLLAVDRDAAVRRADALAARLARARDEIRELTGCLDRLAATPIEPDALTDRLRRMVELAHAEAEEITSSARAAAEQSRLAGEQTADRLRRRAEYLVAEADRRRQEMETEHRELLARAHRQVEVLTREAERRRRELDEQAARLRHQIQTDFELAMAGRRAETMRELADERAAAEARAENLVRAATDHAHRIVGEARAQVARLRDRRDRIAAGLRAAQETLAEAGPLLAPLPEEAEVLAPAREAAEVPAPRQSSQPEATRVLPAPPETEAPGGLPAGSGARGGGTLVLEESPVAEGAPSAGRTLVSGEQSAGGGAPDGGLAGSAPGGGTLVPGGPPVAEAGEASGEPSAEKGVPGGGTVVLESPAGDAAPVAGEAPGESSVVDGSPAGERTLVLSAPSV